MRVGTCLEGPLFLLQHSYLSDIAIPFGIYFLLFLNDMPLRFRHSGNPDNLRILMQLLRCAIICATESGGELGMREREGPQAQLSQAWKMDSVGRPVVGRLPSSM